MQKLPTVHLDVTDRKPEIVADADFGERLLSAARNGDLKGLPLNWVKGIHPDGDHSYLRLNTLEARVHRESPGWYALTVGTPGWGFNRIRSFLLPKLIDDLTDAIDSGMDPEVSSRISHVGEQLISLRPDQPLMMQAWLELRGFSSALLAWRHYADNDVESTHDRWANVHRLREERRKFSNFVRVYQGVIAIQADWNFLEEVMAVLDAAVNDSNGRLRRLATSLRHLRRGRNHKKVQLENLAPNHCSEEAAIAGYAPLQSEKQYAENASFGM